LFRRILFAAFLCLLFIPACLAEVEYAMQGDVRVYVENGLCGLEDAEGNRLCEAKYDWIDPFLNRDYAVFHVLDGLYELCGIISRNGEEIVPAKWTLIEFTSDGLTAMGYDYDDSENRTIRHVYDLATGKVLYEEARNEHVSVEGNRINVYSHHKKGYYRPPFHTDIYDSRMNLIFSADARLVDFGGYYHAQYGDGSLGVLDMDGNVILSGVKSLTFRDDGTISYHWEQYRHSNVFEACVDIVGNALDRALWKNKGNYRDRNCVEWVLYRFGIVTQPREVIPISGILFEDGTVFEYSGDLYRDSMEDYSGSIKHGGEGLYLVHVGGGEYKDGWIYIDQTGNQAIPGRFDRAYTFIDGAAVVYDYNDGYRLIGKDGKMVSDIHWTDLWINDDVYEHTVFPVYLCDNDNGFHYRIMDRRGNFISDTLYRSVDWDYHGWFCATNVRGKSTFLREDGSLAINGIWDGHFIGENDGAPGPWVKIDGLIYQIDKQTGKPTHEQGYSDVIYDCARLPDGENCVVIDEKGNPTGPYYGANLYDPGSGF